MQMIYVLHIVICVFLVLTILFQDGKAGGFAGPADNAAAKAVFGAKGAGDFLTKVTTYLAIFFMATSLTLALVDTDPSKSIADDFAPSSQEQPTSLDATETNSDSQTADSTSAPESTGDVVITDEEGNKTTVPLGEAIEGMDVVPWDEVPEELREGHRKDRARIEAEKKAAEGKSSAATEEEKEEE